MNKHLVGGLFLELARINSMIADALLADEEPPLAETKRKQPLYRPDGPVTELDRQRGRKALVNRDLWHGERKKR